MNEAKKLDPTLPDDVSIFVNDSDAPNAFAVGRKSVCVTKGLIRNTNISEEHIEAVLAHELGHLSHKDTDILLLLNVGNVIQNMFFKVLNFFAVVLTWILGLIGVIFGSALSSSNNNSNGAADAGGGLGVGIGKLLHWILNKITALYWYLAHLCMMRASRNDEFKADEFAFNLGKGNHLCSFLDWLEQLYSADTDQGPQGFLAFLESSHPPTDDRIAHMQEMGATYSQNKRA